MIVQTLFKPFLQVLSETSTSLVLSLNHASPDVRLLAVKHLAERIAAGETLESFCAQSLLQRLRDDKLQVVNAALAIGKVRPALLCHCHCRDGLPGSLLLTPIPRKEIWSFEQAMKSSQENLTGQRSLS